MELTQVNMTKMRLEPRQEAPGQDRALFVQMPPEAQQEAIIQPRDMRFSNSVPMTSGSLAFGFAPMYIIEQIKHS